MELWKGTVLALMTLSIAVGLFRLFWGKNTYEKQQRFLFSILCISIIASPLLSLDWNALSWQLPKIHWETSEVIDQTWESTLLNETKDQLTIEVETLLSEHFSLYVWDATVFVDLQCYGQRLFLHGIEVRLTQSNAYMEKDVQHYLEKQLDCSVTVCVVDKEEGENG